jgi:hypothetical protein
MRWIAVNCAQNECAASAGGTPNYFKSGSAGVNTMREAAHETAKPRRSGGPQQATDDELWMTWS